MLEMQSRSTMGQLMDGGANKANLDYAEKALSEAVASPIIKKKGIEQGSKIAVTAPPSPTINPMFLLAALALILFELAIGDETLGLGTGGVLIMIWLLGKANEKKI